MPIDTLDRTLWSLDQTYRYICRICRARHEAATGEKVVLDVGKILSSTATGSSRWQNINLDASRQLWQALRQGNVHAQGRYSDSRNPVFPDRDAREWIFHSSQLVWIPPEHWISGVLHVDDGSLPERLELQDGEYIDIQIPRFMAQAIWTMPPPKPVEPTEYTTPYLELVKRAISENGIDDWDQSKKVALVAWFKDQHVEGEPLSGNLANAMATIIRMPSSQRGGGKRSWPR